MEVTTTIPKLFWYTLSGCMALVTIIGSVIAYRASNMSIEVSNLKINMKTVTEQAKDLVATVKEEHTASYGERADFQPLSKKLDEKVKRLEKLLEK